MTFAAPTWLLLAPLALLVLLALPRRRRVNVASTFLWRKVEGEDMRRSRWRPPDPLRLLQMALLVVVALLLAEPRIGASRSGSTVIVIDSSASMLATDVAPSRFHAALGRLNEMVRDWHGSAAPDASLHVVAASDAPMVVAVRAAGTAYSPLASSAFPLSGAAPDWTATLELALATGGAEADLVVITDDLGAANVAPLLTEPTQAVRGRVHVVGGAVANRGLAQLEVVADGEAGFLITGEVLSFGQDGPVPEEQVDVEIWVATRDAATPLLWQTANVTVRGGRAEFSLPLDAASPSLVEARLPTDAYPADDRWAVALRAVTAPARLAYVGPEGRTPLLALLESHPGIEVSRLADTGSVTPDFDLTIVEGVGIGAERPPTPTAWFGALPLEIPPSGAASRVDPLAWADDPLLEGVNVGDFSIDAAARPPVLEGALVLLRSSDGPLVQVRAGPDGREAYVAFDSRSTDWSERLGFAVFVDNLTEWLTAPGRQCTVGVRCYVAPQTRAASRVRTPGGREVDLAPAVGRAPHAPAPLAPSFVPYEGGVHVVGDGPERQLVAVDRLGHEVLDLYSPSGAEQVRADQSPRAPWRSRDALLAAALALAVAEAVLWWLTTSAPLRTEVPATGMRAALLVALLLSWVEPPIPTRSEAGGVVTIVDEDVAARLADGVASVPDGLPLPAYIRAVVVARDLPHADPADGLPAGSVNVPGFDSALAVALDLAERHGAQVLYHSAAVPDLTRPPLASGTLAATGAAFSVVSGDRATAGAAAVTAIQVPARVREGETFYAVASVESAAPTAATLRVAVDGEPTASYDLELVPGPNRFDVPLTAPARGRHVVEVAVEVMGDAESRDDVMAATLSVDAAPSVTVVASRLEMASALGDLYSLHGFAVRTLAPGDLPRATERDPAMLRFLEDVDVLVLADVPATTLSWAQQEQVQRWAREKGGGLLVLGGTSAFAPGGYLGSKLEEALPLATQVPKDKPKAALVFVIDRSGSMQQESGDVTRLDVALRSTVEAVGLLDEASEVGVVAFDSEAMVVRPLGLIGEGVPVEEALAELRPGGGTDLSPALALALEQFDNVAPTLQRHAVVMSDGLSRPGPIRELVDRFVARGITVSTVAIGQGADARMLAEVAAAGRGVAHVAADARALPSILAQETLFLSEELTDTEAVAPVVASRPEWLPWDGGELPPLLGRNYAELKEGARLVVATSELDPLLATWQYGVGRVAAMATDGIGPWASAWVVDPEVERMWVQLTRWLLPTVVTEDLAVAEPDAAAIRYPRRLVPDANVDTYLSSLATLTGGDPRFDPALAPAPRARLVMREAWRPWAVVGFALALLAFTWGQLIARPRRLGVP